MVRQPATVPADLPVSLLAGEFLRTGRHGFPVLDSDGSLFGVVSLADYRRSVANGHEQPEKLTVKDISTMISCGLTRSAPCAGMKRVDGQKPYNL
ncbi:MAG: CBS domain-containing protein [Anaerolineales bacterium]